jgi:putative ABC transport system permease protein
MASQLNIIIRLFFRKPLYSLITFFGFTIGVASSLLIYLWIADEFSYEKFHPDFNRIYRVLTLVKEGDEIVKSAGCYRPLAKTLKMTFPQVKNACYLSFSSEDSPLKRENGTDKIEARCMTTNDDFFQIFSGFNFLEGSPEKAFSDPSDIILSEEVAKKLFGQESALGKNIISDKYEKEVYKVSGVIRIPRQSHINFGFILSERNNRNAGLADSWGDKAHVHVYIKLAKNAIVDENFLRQITNHPARVSMVPDKLMFQPLTDIHLFTDYPTYIYDKNISSYKYVMIFSGLALLIILMAVVNFSVLSVARSSERATEIGLKKVCGADRLGIISRFMGEAMLQTFAASLLSVFLLWLIIPWFNRFTGQYLRIEINFRLILSLFILTTITGMAAGFYPALYLSSLNPLKIFRGGTKTGSKTGFTRLLVVVQFSIASFLIIATFVFVKQLNYIRGKDLGYDSKNIVVIPTGLWYENSTFKEELLRNPNVLGVSATAYAPVNFGWQRTFAIKRSNRIDSIRASLLLVDEDFAKTYSLQLAKGRFLQMNYQAFWEAQSSDSGKKLTETRGLSLPVVINETAEKAIRFDNPVGKKIGNYIIVGVVKDFNFLPLNEPIGPLIMTNDPQSIMTMSVRIRDRNRAETLKFISNTYRKNRDSRSFSYSYLEDLLAQQYIDEMKLRNLTLIFSILAIIISMLGILGMSVFSCDRRAREIGIRRANGAKIIEIMIMLNKDFLKWVALAFIIACPIAWFVMYRWLDGFAYRTRLSWWLFALAGAIQLAVAIIVVSWQSWKAATRNPVESLKCA